MSHIENQQHQSILLSQNENDISELLSVMGVPPTDSVPCHDMKASYNEETVNVQSSSDLNQYIQLSTPYETILESDLYLSEDKSQFTMKEPLSTMKNNVTRVEKNFHLSSETLLDQNEKANFLSLQSELDKAQDRYENSNLTDELEFLHVGLIDPKLEKTIAKSRSQMKEKDNNHDLFFNQPIDELIDVPDIFLEREATVKSNDQLKNSMMENSVDLAAYLTPSQFKNSSSTRPRSIHDGDSDSEYAFSLHEKTNDFGISQNASGTSPCISPATTTIGLEDELEAILLEDQNLKTPNRDLISDLTALNEALLPPTPNIAYPMTSPLFNETNSSAGFFNPSIDINSFTNALNNTSSVCPVLPRNSSLFEQSSISPSQQGIETSNSTPDLDQQYTLVDLDMMIESLLRSTDFQADLTSFESQQLASILNQELPVPFSSAETLPTQTQFYTFSYTRGESLNGNTCSSNYASPPLPNLIDQETIVDNLEHETVRPMRKISLPKKIAEKLKRTASKMDSHEENVPEAKGGRDAAIWNTIAKPFSRLVSSHANGSKNDSNKNSANSGKPNNNGSGEAKTQKEAPKPIPVEMNGQIKYKCPYVDPNTGQPCDRIYSRPTGNISTHMKKDHQNQENQFICPECSKSFSRSNDMKRHVREVHSEQYYYCPFCSVGRKRKDQLTQHIIKMHTNSQERL